MKRFADLLLCACQGQCIPLKSFAWPELKVDLKLAAGAVNALMVAKMPLDIVQIMET